MKRLVKIYARPRLRSPCVIAAWPGVGDVAVIIANYLKKHLDFKELGEIEASHFFDPVGVLVRDGVVEAPQFPENRFYYWKNKAKGNDIILFIGDDQPVVKAYELANCVLDVALRFQAKRVYTFAAALTRIHHTEPSKVWGVVSTPELAKSLKPYDLVQGSNVQIAGLNGLLLGITRERDMEGICLLGEVPMYASRMQNPMAALAVLKVLTRMLGIEVDIVELARIASETSEKMKQAAAEAMGQYIDSFTQPIWEQGQEEGEEGEAED